MDVVLIGHDDGDVGDLGRTREHLRTVDGVLAHHPEFGVVLLAGLVQDGGGDPLFADVVQDGRDGDVPHMARADGTWPVLTTFRM